MGNYLKDYYDKNKMKMNSAQRERCFYDSLEIVQDSQKIKNIREVNDNTELYEQNYIRIFGRGHPEPGCTGTYKWDDNLKKLVKVSDEVPLNMKGLITL